MIYTCALKYRNYSNPRLSWYVSILTKNNFQLPLMVGTVTLETGPDVLLNVEEELRKGLELAQTLLPQTEELTV